MKMVWATSWRIFIAALIPVLVFAFVDWSLRTFGDITDMVAFGVSLFFSLPTLFVCYAVFLHKYLEELNK